MLVARLLLSRAPSSSSPVTKGSPLVLLLHRRLLSPPPETTAPPPGQHRTSGRHIAVVRLPAPCWAQQQRQQPISPLTPQHPPTPTPYTIATWNAPPRRYLTTAPAPPPPPPQTQHAFQAAAGAAAKLAKVNLAQAKVDQASAEAAITAAAAAQDAQATPPQRQTSAAADPDWPVDVNQTPLPPFITVHDPEQVHQLQLAAARAHAAERGSRSNDHDHDMQPSTTDYEPEAPTANEQTDAHTVSQTPAHFAIVYINGRQYKVVPGALVMLDSLMRTLDVGTQVTFDKVLLYGTRDMSVVGRPTVPKAAVKATVQEHNQTQKVLVFKKRRRKHSRRTRGYRHQVTIVRIDSIEYEA